MASKQSRVSFEGAPDQARPSRIARPSGIARPTSAAGPCRAAAAGAMPKAAADQPCSGASTSKVCGNPKRVTKKFTIPALSIPPKTPPVDPVLERLKKRTIRRNAPEGEDLKKIKEIVKGINKEPVTVQEFVGLVSPYTGDTGNVLRAVMGDDLSSFRKMAKRVYDTMTQDVSDVLANEQIHLTDYYNERYTLFTDKMMRTIEEIYRYAPSFDFELYYTDPQYLSQLFPLKEDLELDPVEEEMQRRQEAYHRLQWLRSEGIRLSEENGKLQARLRELKKQQKEEMIESKRQEEAAEVRKNELEATQNALHEQLVELNESIEKSLIIKEEQLRIAEDSQAALSASLKKAAGSRSRPRIKGEPWNVKTAKKIEEETLTKDTEEAISSVSVLSSKSRTGVIKKRMRAKIKRAPLQANRDTSPFHFSPIKEGPAEPARKRSPSPFHYSPPKSPPRDASAFRYAPQRSTNCGAVPETVRVESSTTVIEEAAPAKPALPRMGRRQPGPKDTWGGFG